MIRRIPLTEWVPDAGIADLPAITGIANGWPGVRGYEPAVVASTSAYSAFAGSAIAPGWPAVDKAGDPYFFLGTTTQLYRASATATLDNVSGTTAYATATKPTWDFVQFGDTMLASNFVDPIQSMTISGTSFTALNVAASTPTARWLTASRNFVVLGYTNDTTDGTQTNRVRWSALGDATDWDISAVTQADFQDLDSAPGVVQGVFGGEYVIVFQERAITRMSYVGPPAIWQFDTIEPGIGLYAPLAAAQRGNQIFFLAQDGFYVLVNGNEVRKIGEGKVNKTFWSNFNDEANKHQITCAVEPRSSRVHWQYPRTDVGLRNTFVYDYAFDKWGFVSTGYSNKFFPSSFLSNVHDSNACLCMINNVDKQIDLMNSAATASITVNTSAIQLTPGRNSMVRAVELIANSVNAAQEKLGPGSVVMQSLAGTKWRQDTTLDNVVIDEAGSPRTSGRITTRVSGKIHKFNATFSIKRAALEASTEVVGLDIDYVPTNQR